MVTFVASLIGAAAVFARVTSAVPMEYSGMSSSAAASMPSMSSMGSKSSDSGSYGSGSSGYGSGDKSYGSSAAPPSYSMSSSSSSYGSGSSNWNKGGYDNCVQQCVAQYGSPSSMYMPPSSTSSGSSGNGKTHTVVVAPTQGVLRYVPFALNASVGDTVKFMWGANNHTVTKSSQLSLCNKTGDQPFASGEQNKSFVFTQVVNDTNPTFYYCGTPTHCQKGMFGIINPPNAYMQSTSVGMMMPSLAGKYPSTQAAMSYTSNVTSNSSASSWGMNIDMSGMPSWSQQYTAENVLFTRAFLGMNPETMNSDGSVDLSALGSSAVMVPTDVAASMDNAGNSTSSSSYGSPASSSASSSASSASASAVGGSSKSSNGAGVLSSPRVAVALVAVVAAFFAL
jgi:plastocyanin